VKSKQPKSAATKQSERRAKGMASCSICGVYFNNGRQLGAHVRRCKRADDDAAAAAAAAAHTTAHATATVTAATGPQPVIEEPVVAAQTANTDLVALARRERWGGKKWRTIRGPVVPRPPMSCYLMCKDYIEVKLEPKCLLASLSAQYQKKST